MDPVSVHDAEPPTCGQSKFGEWIRSCEVFPLSRLRHRLHVALDGDNAPSKGLRISQVVVQDPRVLSAQDGVLGPIRVHYVYANKNRTLDYYWIPDWSDFSVPATTSNDEVRQMARTIARRVVEEERQVVVSCTSGRGRSGTLAAIIAWFVTHLGKGPSPPPPATLSTLIDVVVELRRHRDGQVELPTQFQYIQQLLGL